MFRILQEALTNVQRHSGSRAAHIRVAREPEGIRLEGADAGTGIPMRFRTRQEALFASGLQVAGMRECACPPGGEVGIRSGDRGTTVTVTVPLRE